MNIYGADVVQLRALAAQFDRTADQLDRGRMAVGNAIRISAWIGPFATSFRVQWDSEHSLRIARATHLLRENASKARANAEAQERTSGVDGSTGGVTGGGPVRYPPEGSSAQDVRNWWNSLSKEQQDRLIKHDPLRIGNLNDIPLEVRAQANQVTAEHRLDDVRDRLAELGDQPPEVNPLSTLVPALHALQLQERARWIAEHDALLQEQAYLNAVTSGQRSLVVYDPAEERIVEMIGTPGPNTTNVVTYVPGIGTDMGSFYNGSTQQVATYLEQSDRSGGTVAFVYKDGPWSTMPWESSDRANTNMEFALKEGRQLAEFEAAVALEPGLAGARTTSLAHSAGMTVVSASEVAGAHYDKEFSLAGAMLAPGWKADSTTEYFHYQYGVDAINYADSLGDLPDESRSFEQRFYAPETNVLGIQNPLANHGRIASGPAENQEALDQMYRDIHSD